MERFNTRIGAFVGVSLAALYLVIAGATGHSAVSEPPPDLRARKAGVNVWQTLALLANKGPSAVAIVDVRSPQRFRLHHLPGAINLPQATPRALLRQFRGKKAVLLVAEKDEEASRLVGKVRRLQGIPLPTKQSKKNSPQKAKTRSAPRGTKRSSPPKLSTQAKKTPAPRGKKSLHPAPKATKSPKGAPKATKNRPRSPLPLRRRVATSAPTPRRVRVVPPTSRPTSLTNAPSSSPTTQALAPTSQKMSQHKKRASRPAQARQQRAKRTVTARTVTPPKKAVAARTVTPPKKAPLADRTASSTKRTVQPTHPKKKTARRSAPPVSLPPQPAAAKGPTFYFLRGGVRAWFLALQLPIPLFSSKPPPFGYKPALKKVKLWLRNPSSITKKALLQAIGRLALLDFQPNLLQGKKKPKASKKRKKIAGGCG